jgi:hypothetical protein
MSYKEIEVEVFKKGQGTTKYTFNTDVISHYKQYIDAPEDKDGSVLTMLYLKGNPNVLRLDCGYDTFKKKLGSNSVDLSSLSVDQKEEILSLLESFVKVNC